MGNQCTAKKKQKKKQFRLDDRLGFNDLNDEDLIQISQLIKKEHLNSQKLKLGLSINKVGNQGLMSLGEAVGQCIQLKELNLDLAANKYDQNGVKMFCDHISNCRDLTSLTLSFSYCQLQEEDFNYMQQVFSQFEQLTYLSLTFSYSIVKDGAKHLGQLISMLSKLESFYFDLRESQLTNQGLIGLADGIISNHLKLTKIVLILEYNQISEVSAVRLSQAISMCQNLIELTLFLKANRVGMNGAQQLGIGIGQCPNLKRFNLELMYNHFGEEGFILLAKGISRSKSLIQFSLDNSIVLQVTLDKFRMISKKIQKLVTYKVNYRRY
ncbi:kinase domain protein (macronuclear) [Tetrahymena thermophila SB210]|uniref:Kinase domain protein n=1 Tax=Tetrahymena thermophila (strain SB210) TaxID=312017 RepID=A4VE97_TETTS|nr:kinase domain protein [Tetrahymena thermophila SB210]EDK31862.2 kinase domain protein [Tetrahymena thermophila SB210]|eukprot:XP_001471260.2 kinase domain protein [Tetrahymena thermophila SB210]